jgi:hypothetical protein
MHFIFELALVSFQGNKAIAVPQGKYGAFLEESNKNYGKLQFASRLFIEALRLNK